ncbi:MAG: DUF4367 domain-containing protein [Clostridia bacterium]|nr:DUF4367 domain-containing protein [Clostridia bacterium]
MSKNLRDEAVFDTILAQAFRDAAEADFKEEKNGAEPIKLTAAQLKEERKAYERYEKKNRSGVKRFTGMHKAVACILLVCTIGFAAMFAIPPVRAAIVGAVVEFFTEYMSLDFGDSDGDAITVGEHKFDYIPDGFVMIDSVENKIANKYTFENKDTNESFIIRFTTENISGSNYDFKNTEYEKLDINGYSACLIKSGADLVTAIVFNTNSNVITVSGTISEKEIIKIAEKIS